MYLLRNILARSGNRCCSINATMRAVCTATVSNMIILSVAEKLFCGEFMSPATLKRI